MKADKTLAILTVILCALIIWAGVTGLTTTDYYALETDNWRLQTIGQDMIDLCLIVPILLNTALMISRGAQDAKLLWAGAMVYVVYTYTIFCFSVHFNSMFLVYCAILGLSIFSLLWFVYAHRKSFRYKLSGKTTGVATGIYFMLTALFFAMLWLSEIVLAILTDQPPASLAEGNFFTNPVQVIDLAICLPGLFITGLLLLRREKPGLVLAPVLLTFMLLMDITVGVLSAQAGQYGDIPGVALVMFSLAAVTLLLLVLNLRSKNHLV
jgi:hypothetical protein